ncbi:MAG: PRC-barrel domain-containing protein [Syntrophobacteraceae bacterium]|nr:PRC-barrel domain-containing protein [Syntrophobacteraceae bacterium]
MRKFNILMSFLMIAGLVASAPAFGAEMNEHGSSMMNNHNSYSNEMSKGALSHSIDLSSLLNKNVRDQQGQTIGEVSDVVVGPDGQAQFVILSRSGMLKTSGKYIPVPWKTFTSHWTNEAQANMSGPIDLSLAQTRLDRAPGFSNKRDLTSSQTREKVCQYFKGDCAQNMFDRNTAS